MTATKVGHRSLASARSATLTGIPLVKHSTHGPWSVCSWSSSIVSISSVEAVTTCRLRCGSASRIPAASAISRSTQCRTSRFSSSTTS